MSNPHVIEAITQLLKLDQAGKIPEDAPISFSFQQDPAQGGRPSTDAEYIGEAMDDAAEAEEIDEVPEGKVGVVPDGTPIKEEENPMLAHVIRRSVVATKPEPARYSNGALVTKANQKLPGLPPVQASRK